MSFDIDFKISVFLSTYLSLSDLYEYVDVFNYMNITQTYHTLTTYRKKRKIKSERNIIIIKVNQFICRLALVRIRDEAIMFEKN